MKVLFSATILILSSSLSSAYKRFSSEQALSECSQCLDVPANRFCTNGTYYYCCDQSENTIYCDPSGPNITCSHFKYTEALNKYRFCPQNTDLCDNQEPIELQRSSIPLLSNLDEQISTKRLPLGQVCVYEVDIVDNEDSQELVEIEIEGVKHAKLGVELFQMDSLDSMDTGFISPDNCSMEVNCTKDTDGNHVYYLSNVQKLYLTVVGTAPDNETQASSYVSLTLSLREKTNSVILHLSITFGLLVVFYFGFSKSVEMMRGQMETDMQTRYSQAENLESEENERMSRGSSDQQRKEADENTKLQFSAGKKQSEHHHAVKLE